MPSEAMCYTGNIIFFRGKFMYKKIIFIFLSLVLITACATNPSNLKKTTSKQYFILEKDISRTAKVGIGYMMTEGLRKGKYTATFEDESGIYFQGEGPSVYYRHELKNMNRDNNGGIWIPKDEQQDNPRLYYYIGKEIMEHTEKSGTGLLGYGISSSQLGKIEFHPGFKDPAFMEKISIINK
jgi:hypothetical protein